MILIQLPMATHASKMLPIEYFWSIQAWINGFLVETDERAALASPFGGAHGKKGLRRVLRRSA
jgi:hypothetical protein